MRRRALRPSFVVTFALGAAALASGCGGKDSGNGDSSIGDSSIGDGGCPADVPWGQIPCDLPPSVTCNNYGICMYTGVPIYTAVCQQGVWSVSEIGACNPPPPPLPTYDAGPDVDDAAPDVPDAGSDVYEGGPDGEGQDGGHD